MPQHEDDKSQTTKRRQGTIGTSDRFTDASGHVWKSTKKGWRNFTKKLAARGSESNAR